MEDLIVEDGRVVGARVTRNGASLNVEARKGVLLAAGGFSRNADMRRQYSGDQPNEAQWSIANAGDTGEVLQTAMRLGAKTDLLDEAWWLPSIFIADGGDAAQALGSGRQRPGRHLCRRHRQAILQRVELLRRGRQGDVRQQGGAVLDGLRRGLRPPIRLGANPFKKRSLPEELIERGAVLRGNTIADLARQMEVPADALEQTVQRFNGFAAKGLDPDFGRGQSAYNDCLGDPGYRPNAALGPLDRAPYYATKVVPADVGTCGGRDHQRVRAGPRRGRPRDRRAVRDRATSPRR